MVCGSSRPVRAGLRLAPAAHASAKRTMASQMQRRSVARLPRRHAVEAAEAGATASEAEEAEAEEDEAEEASYTAVVKLLTTYLEPDYLNPWQTKTSQRSVGSGVVISRDGDGGDVLTAAHVVANATFIEVQLADSPEKHRGYVMHVSHESDLALVRVESGFAGVRPLPVAAADTLPALRDKVYVLGFPVGGDDLSITEGVVSRVEVQRYSHSHMRALAVTVDAAVNSGNSGGPVCNGDGDSSEVIGIAFQGYAGSNVENQGHMVPAPLIRHFLEGMTREQSGLPSLGIHIQYMQSPALRASRGMESAQETGVLVSHVEYGSSADGVLLAGDVLLEIGGVAIANDGTARHYGFRLALIALVHSRFIGDRIQVKVLRAGERVTLEVELRQTRALVPRGQYDVLPPYAILGGMLFQPLSLEYLQSWGDLKDAPTHLMALYYDAVASAECREIVVLTQILADEANIGIYFDHVGLDVVTHVNRIQIRDLAHLLETAEASIRAGEPFVEFRIARGAHAQNVVLEVSELALSRLRMRERYQLPADASRQYCDDFSGLWDLLSTADAAESI